MVFLIGNALGSGRDAKRERVERARLPENKYRLFKALTEESIQLHTKFDRDFKEDGNQDRLDDRKEVMYRRFDRISSILFSD